jgi:hypothetical protein
VRVDRLSQVLRLPLNVDSILLPNLESALLEIFLQEFQVFVKLGTGRTS